MPQKLWWSSRRRDWKCLSMIFLAWQRGHPVILQKTQHIIHHKGLPVRIHPRTGFGIHSQSYNESWHSGGLLYFCFPTIHSSCLKTYLIVGFRIFQPHEVEKRLLRGKRTSSGYYLRNPGCMGEQQAMSATSPVDQGNQVDHGIEAAKGSGAIISFLLPPLLR